MAGTITFSGVEQVSVREHLTRCHARLARGDPDSITIAAFLERLAKDRTVLLSRVEIFTLIRCLRHQHQEFDRDMLELEERRLRGGHNGQLDAAHRILEAESQILADVMRRLWLMI